MKPAFRHILRVLLVIAACALPGPARAQESDILRGRVFGPDSTPLPGVTIAATGARSQITKTARSDARGSFTIIFPDGGDSYVVTATAIGFQPGRREVVRDEGQLALPAVDIYLSRVAQQLQTLRVTAQRPRPQRSDFPQQEVGAGATQSFVSTGGSLTGDPSGSISAALANIPGLSLMSDGTGGPPTVSAFGLSADQNLVTMNGVTMGSGALPRGMAFGQVSMNSYDPGRMGTGVSVNFYAPSGSNFTRRSLQLTLEDPSLQWTDPASQRLGAEYFSGIASGTISGAMKEDKAYYNVGWQIRRRTSELPTLLSANAEGLLALGISQESVTELLALSNELGIPVRPLAVPDERRTTDGSFLSRFDYSHSAATNFNITLNGSFNRNDGNATSATSLPSYGSRGRGWNVQVQPRFSTYFWRSVLNEATVALGTSSSESAPYLGLPSARVLVSSTLGDGSSGTTNVQVGGNPGGENESRSYTAQLRNQTSWYTLDSKHQIRLTFDGSVSRSRSTQSGNRFGTFTFNSLADFESGRAATFSRTLSFPGTNSRSATWLVGLGDTSRRAPRLQFQYGVQAFGASVPTRPAYNRAVDSLFGRRTDEIPGTVSWSPMGSFSWSVGSYMAPFFEPAPGRTPPPRGTLTGGISRRQGSVSASMIESVARQTGLPGDLRQLTCYGDAAPVPDWQAYVQSAANIPDVCADGTPGSVLVQSNPGVQLFDPRFEGSEVWRMNLGFNGTITASVRGSITGVYALNRQQPGSYDLNFNPVTRFTLPGESNRPVFVSPASISTATGAVASRESRLHDQFAQVNERRSDLESDSRQIMTSLSYSPFTTSPLNFGGSVTANYVYSRMRERTRGFGGGTTAGDPRVTEWGRSSGDGRHQVTLQTNLRVPEWFSVGMFTQFSSGRPYTPRVNTDINGDGAANDRAFVFDPATAADTAVRSAMNALLAGGGSGAECLRRQLGRIAGRNSCEGPWTARMQMSVTLNARRLGLGNRTTLRLSIGNALYAVDRLLHGTDDIQGWGQSFVNPDATLLNVRGFDATAQRYVYEVNPRFGSIAASRALVREPFRIALDVGLEFGPPQERMLLRNMLRPRPTDSVKVLSEAQIKTRLMPPTGRSEITALVNLRSPLALTAAQVDTLNKIASRVTAERDSIATDMAKFLASLPDHRRITGDAAKRYQAGNLAMQMALARLTPEIRRILTEEQVRKLPLGVSSWLNRTPRDIERMQLFFGGFGGFGGEFFVVF
jgi:hypothetical protein